MSESTDNFIVSLNYNDFSLILLPLRTLFNYKVHRRVENRKLGFMFGSEGFYTTLTALIGG